MPYTPKGKRVLDTNLYQFAKELRNVYYTRDEIDEKTAAIPRYQVVPIDHVPEVSEMLPDKIYLVYDPSAESSGDTDNNYTEWILVDKKREKLGEHKLDLSSYAKTADVQKELDKKLNLTGGTVTGNIEAVNGANFVGTLKGMAQKTIADQYGNVIDTTYNKKMEPAVSASRLAPGKAINGVVFDGTKDITIEDNTKLSLMGGELKGTLTAPLFIGTLQGKADSAKTAEKATYADKLFSTVSINNVPFDGSKNITIYDNTKLSLEDGGEVKKDIKAPNFIGALKGNADTASKLDHVVTINGIEFDGSKDIVIADDTKLSLKGGTVNGNISAVSFVGDLNGLAAKAKEDDAGNNIIATYATIASLNNYPTKNELTEYKEETTAKCNNAIDDLKNAKRELLIIENKVEKVIEDAEGGEHSPLATKVELKNYLLKEDAPKKLPNPNAVTFVGGVNSIYDGTKEVTVEIPNISGLMYESKAKNIFLGKDDIAKKADADNEGNRIQDTYAKINALSELERRVNRKIESDVELTMTNVEVDELFNSVIFG